MVKSKSPNNLLEPQDTYYTKSHELDKIRDSRNCDSPLNGEELESFLLFVLPLVSLGETLSEKPNDAEKLARGFPTSLEAC